jgi:hypothetical protein
MNIWGIVGLLRRKQNKFFKNATVFCWTSLLLFGSGHPLCFADEVYTFVVKKQADKEKNRWTLADWLTTRDKMRMQDLWLSLHSPSPYEFYLSGNYQMNQTQGGVTSNAWEVAFAAFVTAFGLEFRYELSQVRRMIGVFDMRLFGSHDQATNLTLQVGLKQDELGGESYRNPLAGLSMTVYLAQFFGVEGVYRHYFSSTPSSLGVSLSGDRFQGGAFLDFKFLRIYGDYFNDVETLQAASAQGVMVGTRLYF